ncbi:plant UBX domain-containing protein 7-like [Herrania umbratica]|uniref:Plant UBX domain-containing protein 7-like n=1 Tax=Herrania umbratica TaxID=108875 RepID=A0A6J1A017_9ROSI|nr:plant UBX domain-containing protein 7-like [Herrania umbratica]
MERILSATDKQRLVSSFLEIAVGQTAETATQFLQATSWKLDEAIQLFYVGNEGGVVGSSSEPRQVENMDSRAYQNSGALNEHDNVGSTGGDEGRPPLPVVREILHADAMLYGASRLGYPPQEFRNFHRETIRPGVWQSDEGASSTVDAPRDNLSSLFRPPFHLMFQGPFREAKAAASLEDKWLVVNLQSTKEFSSHMLNRDTWGNETVSQTIKTNFIFWQAYDDASESRKVCAYYKLDSIPVVLVIDPITGEKMRSWCGMVQPESLLEDLLRFMDGGPRDYHATLSHKRPRGSSIAPQQKVRMSTDETMEDEEMRRAAAASLENVKDKEEPCSTKKPTYPPLPEEPKGDKSLLCRVGVRLPGGCRVQRNFLRTDSIQLLWSFCYAQLGEAESKPFRLTQPIPGASKSLDYDSQLTFEESGLANSMITVAWE